MNAHALSHKIFRGSIALEAQMGETRITESQHKPIPTINLMAATAKDLADKSHRAGYNWENALRLQITPREMSDVLACLLGYLDNVEFTHHGAKRDKSYTINNLEKNTAQFILSGAGHKQYRFGLNPTDRFALSSLCFRAFQRQHGGLSAEVLMGMLKDTYCMNH